MAKTNVSNLVKISDITPEQVASICDHTFLTRPEVYRNEGVCAPMEYKKAFEKFMNEVVTGKLTPYAVCVRPEDVTHAKKILEKGKKANVVIAAVVGFPFGGWYETDFKVAEAMLAIKYGATEIDMIINVEKVLLDDWAGVEEDMKGVVEAVHAKQVRVKLILETSELTNAQIVRACKLADKLGFDFVKTSTGFDTAGAKPEHLKLMRENFSKGVKMSGGVNKDNLAELLTAVSGRNDGYIELDPLKVRIGESSLLKGFSGSY